VPANTLSAPSRSLLLSQPADLAEGRLLDLTQLQAVFSPDPADLPSVVVQLRPLSDYDPLLEGEQHA